jgi:hypothetical protein
MHKTSVSKNLFMRLIKQRAQTIACRLLGNGFGPRAVGFKINVMLVGRL